jgi:hypothetical protein
MILAMAAVVFAASMSSIAAQSKDPKIGTWKLNVEKSKFSPGPAYKSLTVTFEPAGKGVKVTTSGVNADGSAAATEYTANYDGKDYPLKGSAMADTVSLKRVNSLTTTRTDKKDGKVVSQFKNAVAKNGKTYTVTIKGKTPKGEPLNNTLVFEKQ